MEVKALSQKDLISILLPLLTVTLGKTLKVFEPHISHLQNGYNNNISGLF